MLQKVTPDELQQLLEWFGQTGKSPQELVARDDAFRHAACEAAVVR
jgi:hypothetical protein